MVAVAVVVFGLGGKEGGLLVVVVVVVLLVVVGVEIEDLIAVVVVVLVLGGVFASRRGRGSVLRRNCLGRYDRYDIYIYRYIDIDE